MLVQQQFSCAMVEGAEEGTGTDEHVWIAHAEGVQRAHKCMLVKMEITLG